MRTKYIKLFENFNIQSKFGTLKDFVDPEYFEDPEDFLSLIDCVELIAEYFGLDSNVDADSKELFDMGLITNVELLDRMQLNRLVCVFNSNDLDYSTDEYLQKLAEKFPNLFKFDSGELHIASRAKGSELDSSGIYSASAHVDRLGNRAAQIKEFQYGPWNALFMLDTDIAKGFNK